MDGNGDAVHVMVGAAFEETEKAKGLDKLTQECCEDLITHESRKTRFG